MARVEEAILVENDACLIVETPQLDDGNGAAQCVALLEEAVC
jgi:hypothetical protein